MTYIKQTWHDAPATDTPLSAARLNHMEDGIADAATAADTPDNWDDITDKPSTFPPSAHTHTASQISDATTTGRAVLTAANAAAARAATGAASQSDMTATQAGLNALSQKLFGLDTTVYASDESKVRKIAPDGTKTDTGIVTNGTIRDLALDSAGNLYFADRVTPGGSAASYFRASPDGVRTDLGIATTKFGLTVGPDDSLYCVVNGTTVRHRTVDGTVTTLPFTGLTGAQSVAVDLSGNVYVLDDTQNQVFKLTPAGVHTTLNFTGLDVMWDIAVDNDGTVYTADFGASTQAARITTMTKDGVQGTIAPPTNARPIGLSTDGFGNLYVADWSGKLVYKRDPAGAFTQVPITGGLSSLNGITVEATPVYVQNKLVVKSPNGTVHAIQVGDDGTLSTRRLP